MKDLKEVVKDELLAIISRATELSVLLGDIVFSDENFYRFISSLTRQSEVELTKLVDEVKKEIASGKAGCNNPE